MEKGRLELIKTKKGNFAVNIILENGRKMSLSDFKLRDNSLNNKEVEIMRENGRVVSMVCEGREIYSQKSSHDNRSYKQENKRMFGRNNPEKDKDFDSNKNRDIYSRAPYNFIPLNRTVVSVEKIPEFDRYYTENRFTGYIDIEIEAKTPLYIRDALTNEEYIEKLKIEEQNRKENKKRQYINPDFFSPGGIPRIPGSSLRGMIRTMVEIMSFGKFGFFEDKRLYYRAVGDTSRLGIDYRNKMVDTKNNYFPKIKAGILRSKGSNKYEILPSKVINGTQIYRINFDKKTGIIDGTDEFRLGDFEFREIYFNPVDPKDHTHYRIDRRTNARIPYQLRYAKLTSVSLTQNNSHPNRGYIISSGHMDKKHMHWVINEADTSKKPIEVDEYIITLYKNDKNREAKSLVDMLEDKENSKHEVPCFYLTNEKDEIIFFGHTGMFRLAYEKTIGDHIPPELKNPNITDIAEAIFGNEKTHAGRVFFEDAYIDEKHKYELKDAIIPKILSDPKPTCFQHYLEQSEENLDKHPKNLAHYNTEGAVIRGYKLYWHRDAKYYEEEEISYDIAEFNRLLNDFGKTKEDFSEFIIDENNGKIKISLKKKMPDDIKEIIIKSIGEYENQHTVFKRIEKGAIFRGRIRFENLSEVELGALLFALDLPEGLAHKIGMGKPLGLGSVKIKPQLYLSDRSKRYSDLLVEWDGLSEENAKIAKIKKEFEDYVLKNLNEKLPSLWDNTRMKEFRIMLNFDKKPENEKTRYMLIKNDKDENEFKYRNVLPKPSEVIED